MAETSTIMEGFSRHEENVGDSIVMTLKCNLCRFTNINKGGMTRHIQAQHKKRGHEEVNGDDENYDERDDKRPKVDDIFEPSIVSTEIDENEELDEFDAVLLAEKDDYDGNDVTFEFSDDLVDKIGNDTNFDINNYEQTEEPNNDESNNLMEFTNAGLEADVAILKARIKFLENESKSKDLSIEEMSMKINDLSDKLSGYDETLGALKKEIELKDKTIETTVSKLNSLETDLNDRATKSKKLVDDNREKKL